MATQEILQSPAQAPTPLADHPFLIAKHFNFTPTYWVDLFNIGDRAASEARSTHLILYGVLGARIDKEVITGDRAFNIATAFFLEEFNKLEDKLIGLVTLLNQVNQAARKQAELIKKAIRPGEDECKVDSLFIQGEKIRFRHGGMLGWYFEP